MLTQEQVEELVNNVPTLENMKLIAESHSEALAEIERLQSEIESQDGQLHAARYSAAQHAERLEARADEAERVARRESQDREAADWRRRIGSQAPW